VASEIFVLDTSAVLAFTQNEAGSERVEEILKTAIRRKCEVFLSFASIAELYYVTWQEGGQSAAREVVVRVKALPVQIIESVERITLLAGSIKANYRLSFADTFIAATAVDLKGILVHKDPEFEQMEGLMSMEKLPYKMKHT
jgi:uncharacterized protein